MSRRKNMMVVVAAGLLALGFTAALAPACAPVAVSSESGCCCSTPSGLDIALECDCCGETDGLATGSCDCERTDEGTSPPCVVPARQTTTFATLERHERFRPTAGFEEEPWRAVAKRTLTTGPPIHVKYCVWLL
jgi:hypothetical protein